MGETTTPACRRSPLKISFFPERAPVWLLAGVMLVAVFRLATKRTSEALLLALLLAVTVVQWNAGFCMGLFSEPRDRNG